MLKLFGSGLCCAASYDSNGSALQFRFLSRQGTGYKDLSPDGGSFNRLRDSLVETLLVPGVVYRDLKEGVYSSETRRPECLRPHYADQAPLMLNFLSQNPRKAHLLSLLVIFLLAVYSNACIATNGGGGTPSVTTTTTTTTTSATPSGCCPALVQTNTSNTNFIDGFMTFVYDSDTCRTSVTATCTSTQNPTLNAGIIANTNNFLATGVGSVSFPGTCDGNGNWLMGTPSLVVQILQCQLTQAT